MKMFILDIKTPAEGDLVIVNYSSPRGGKTSVKHLVAGPRKRPILDGDGFATSIEDVPAETARDIAAVLAKQINSEWMAECFQASCKDDALVIKCTDLVADIILTRDVLGNGGTTLATGGTAITITEF